MKRNSEAGYTLVELIIIVLVVPGIVFCFSKYFGLLLAITNFTSAILVGIQEVEGGVRPVLNLIILFTLASLFTIFSPVKRPAIFESFIGRFHATAAQPAPQSEKEADLQHQVADLQKRLAEKEGKTSPPDTSATQANTWYSSFLAPAVLAAIVTGVFGTLHIFLKRD